MNRAAQLTGLGLLGVLCLFGSSPTRAEEPAAHCSLKKQHGGLAFPVDALTPAARCLISDIVEGATTEGVTGPVVTPITRPLYEFLLNRPPLTASLSSRLNLAPYECTVTDARRFWINDHDGTQGEFTFLFQNADSRIYYIDGFHEGKLLPRVHAKAVVFLRVIETKAANGAPALESTLVTYTKLNDRMLAFLVRLLRPLVGGAVTRKLSKGFDVVNQLSAVAVQSPDKFLNEVTASGPNGPADAQALRALMPQPLAATPTPPSAPPKP